MSPFYTYIHSRPDGRVFYVGKGSGGRINHYGRNEHWERVVKKDGSYTPMLIEYFDDENDALAMERYLIASYRALGFELCNFTDGGEGRSGWVPSVEFRAMVSAIHTGRKRSQETRDRLSASIKIANSRPEVREKHKAAWTDDRKLDAVSRGRALSKEQVSLMLSGNPSRMKGKTHSPEALEKLSLANAGENNPMFGKTFSHTDEAKELISIASRNRVVTPEARASVSLAAKAAWARRKAATLAKSGA